MRVRERMRWPIGLLLGMLSTACASTGGVPKPFPMPDVETVRSGPPPAATPFSSSDELVDAALSLRGVPYRAGGADPRGFDCSGFTQYVFAGHGLTLPREVRDQYKTGRAIRPRDLEPGDLVFFQTTSRDVSHVGIAVGGDEFVHAPSSTGVVRVERLSSNYWSRRLVGVRRVEAP